MPNIQSAKKALRQSKTRQLNNLKKKEAYKNAIKQVKKILSSKDTGKTKEALSRAYQTLDKAAKSKVIDKNKASRLKSRLSHLIARSSKTSS